jgi:uncharacterized protein YfaS (alpha-2-macroglobulin family)
MAQKKGYQMPGNLLKNLLSFEKKEADKFQLKKSYYFTNDIIQAYRLYVLALAKNTSLGRMNQLREYGNLSPQAVWLLASAYAANSQVSEAERLISNAPVNFDSYRYNPYTYGSSDRDEAIALEALCLMGKKAASFKQMKKLASILSSKNWLSTQTTAYGLYAISKFITTYGGASAMQAQLAINGANQELKGNSAINKTAMAFKNGGASLSIKNNGKGVIYGRVVNKGKPPIGEEVESNENISISVSYRDINGNSVDVDKMQQGKNFIMTVTIRNLGMMGELTNIALDATVPSGWEIHNGRMDGDEDQNSSKNYQYQDIRDDKVLTYFDLNTHESKTFNFLLNATYEGKFYLPAVNAEAMYDNSIYARTKGKWIEVVKTLNQEMAENNP